MRVFTRDDFDNIVWKSDLEVGAVLGRDGLRIPAFVVLDDPLCGAIRISIVDVRVKRWTDHLSG